MPEPAPTISRSEWHSTDDQGHVRHLIVESFDGLCQVTDVMLADLMKAAGRTEVQAARSPQLPGVYFLTVRDVHGMLGAAGMVRIR